MEIQSSMRHTTLPTAIRRHDDIEWIEDDKEFGLHFKKGADPELLIKAIKKMDVYRDL